MPKKSKDLKKKSTIKISQKLVKKVVFNEMEHKYVNAEDKPVPKTIRTSITMSEEIHWKLKKYLVNKQITLKEFLLEYVESRIKDIP